MLGTALVEQVPFLPGEKQHANAAYAPSVRPSHKVRTSDDMLPYHASNSSRLAKVIESSAG
jgi:hypothetical protein